MELAARAKNIRRRIVEMVSRSHTSHIGAALSSVDILTALYFSAMRLPPNPCDDSRDRFLMSKGHACSALYATLAERGIIGESEIRAFCTDGGVLPGHATMNCAPGVEASTGSLGHGLSLGAGLALGAKMDKMDYRTFVLMGDGECNEGSVWEAAMFAARAGLDNLIAIVDYNKLQSFGTTKEVMDLEPFAQKWEAFGWAAKEADGHNPRELSELLGSVPFEPGRPSVVIAHTVKGRGVSFMENRLEWHYKSPNEEQARIALEELK